MHSNFLINVFEENKSSEAIIWREKPYNYEWLIGRINFWKKELDRERISQGSVVILEADFSPNSVALFITLAVNNFIIVPLSKSIGANRSKFISISQGEYIISINEIDEVTIEKTEKNANHEFYSLLKKLNHPGLILFSSGSTGESKAAVHDLTGILEKFRVKRQMLRTITFLLYDHIGGVNTMFYILSNGGCVITVEDRNPENVLKTIQKYKAELLPTSPTFINLILLSEAYKRYDLSSLKTITYGTEPMPEITLKRFHEIFPNIRLLQTYGLSELGILRSKSKSSDSLWVKIGGEGFETRVVNGVLQIKARSAMLGYLNAPSPFTDDGWFITGDNVEVDGEYIRIKGRESDIINVGGEKVYPTEVESVLMQIPFILDCMVYGEKNIITGQMVAAEIVLKEKKDFKEVKNEIRKFCLNKLEEFKLPTKIKIVSNTNFNERYKKIRKR